MFPKYLKEYQKIKNNQIRIQKREKKNKHKNNIVLKENKKKIRYDVVM